MNLDRYLPKPADYEPEAPARKFVPHKPLADALEAHRKPRPFDQAAADAFAKGVHWPVGPAGLRIYWDLSRPELKPAPVEARPWRPVGGTYPPIGVNPDDRVEVESKLYGGIFRIPAHWVAWENVARWRFAEPQQ